MAFWTYTGKGIGFAILAFLFLFGNSYPPPVMAQGNTNASQVKNLPAQLDQRSPSEPTVLVIGSDEQFRLASYFFSKQDYGRAITEFERFSFFFPHDAESLVVHQALIFQNDPVK